MKCHHDKVGSIIKILQYILVSIQHLVCVLFLYRHYEVLKNPGGGGDLLRCAYGELRLANAVVSILLSAIMGCKRDFTLKRC